MLNRKTFLALILTVCSCGVDKEYTNEDVIDNFRKNELQIRNLKKYYKSIIPNGKFVEIEFDGSQHLFRFGTYSINPANQEVILPGFLEWDLNTTSQPFKREIKKIGWSSKTLEILKQKLDSANCISIESGEPCKIGFQRRDLGKYSYLVFDKPMPDSLAKIYKNFCPYNLYNDKMVMMWGAGAIGGDCYPR